MHKLIINPMTFFIDSNAIISLSQVSERNGIPMRTVLSPLFSDSYSTVVTTTILDELSPLHSFSRMAKEYIKSLSATGVVGIFDTSTEYPAVRGSHNGELSLGQKMKVWNGSVVFFVFFAGPALQ